MKVRKFCAMLLAFVLCTLLALPAMATQADTDTDADAFDFERFGSLTISYHYTDTEGVEHVLTGVNFYLYQVATLDENLTLNKVAAFESFDLPSDLFSDQTLLVETCDSLTHYISTNTIAPSELVTTNRYGAITVELPTGLYYIDAELFWDDNDTGETVSAYYATPFLVQIGAYNPETGHHDYVYTATPKISMMQLTYNGVVYTHSLTVKKEWEDTEYTTLPSEIQVQLYCDGSCADDEHTEIVTLNAANDWTYTWDGLDASHSWAVSEVDALNDYEVSYQLSIQQDGQYLATITNTYTGKPDPTPTPTAPTAPTPTPPPTPPPTDELPQTGSNLPYIPIWAGAGIGLIALGVLLKKGGEPQCN